MFNLLMLSIVALIAIYFGIKYGIVPYIKDKQVESTPLWKLRENEGKARARLHRATMRLAKMSEQHPNYERWKGIQREATSTVRLLHAEIEELELQYEEERMISGS
jgi:hypothetical protein